MSDITKIGVHLIAAEESAAGVSGWVSVGVAGREFSLGAAATASRPRGDYTYQFGQDANVLHEGRNDPRLPRLDTDDLDCYPVRPRFEPTDGSAMRTGA
ncbi:MULTISPECIES: hypothetical protein [unclassified Streptomyces]|uniref:hypothetical protein n=1 Tax=unclassified Streptomyces TaxID=2593676 RepID=UPI00341291C9